ncbi:DUF4239 domain-containing protein [Methyloceanibacter sp. wino2]|uniref:bestrophin-like domain n=1 Tax=Methyloceanibacter sp. wino2 TaxID=2170729 RepID=UPI00131F2A21|nr:DUF4239 domain-containing protein [Methyloceanibacter sp. wino2]
MVDAAPPIAFLSLMRDTPLWAIGAVVTVVVVGYAVGLMLLTRFHYGADRLKENNEVAGFKYAVVGVLYAVLLAFVVIAVWEDYTHTEDSVRDEAKATIDLYHVALALPDEGSNVREAVLRYTKSVYDTSWDSMALGGRSEAVGRNLVALNQAILDLEPSSRKEQVLFQQALDLLTLITDNRNERLDSANGSVPGVLWFVLIVGGLITLGYPAFFASSNLDAQVLMTGSLAALLALTLFLGIAFDFPFTGDPHISRGPFADALLQME